MKKFLFYITIICIFSLISTSCSREKLDQVWEAQISPLQEKTITEVFKTFDSGALRSACELQNFALGLLIQNSLANKIASYFFYQKNIDIRSKFLNNQSGLITLGLFFALREHQEAARLLIVANNRAVMPLDPWTCFTTAVGTVIGLAQAQAIWQSIVGGATVQTVIDALVLIGRRVAGVITVGLMVVAVGDCLGWWN
jgi:hypothetical protein